MNTVSGCHESRTVMQEMNAVIDEIVLNGCTSKFVGCENGLWTPRAICRKCGTRGVGNALLGMVDAEIAGLHRAGPG